LTSRLDVLPASDADLPVLFGLAHAAFASAPSWDRSRTLQVLAEDMVFVARESAAPAGFVSLRREVDDAMLIDQLLVAPGHEGRGVGHRLLAHAEGYAIANRAGTLAIVVEEGNWRARAFYRRMGFMPVAAELFELVLPRTA
jgi:ribosomal protein S18 acetylase RimI-like enzyme